MRKHYTLTVTLLSFLCGAFAFIIAIFIIDIFWAFLGALLFTLGLLITIPFALYFEEKKYKPLEDH